SWEAKSLRSTENKGRYPVMAWALTDLSTSSLPVLATASHFAAPREASPSLRQLRFVLDSSAGRLRVFQRQPETELWSVPLTDPGLPGTSVHNSTMSPLGGYHSVDQIVIFTVGHLVVALDLVSHQIVWTRNLGLDAGMDAGILFSLLTGGV